MTTGTPNLPERPVLLERRGAVAIVTLNRPAKRNAMDHATLGLLGDIVEALGDDDTVRALILTGAGDRAFSAGADLRALDGLDDAGARDWIALGHAVFDAVAGLPKPTIAAINGFALGGGLELALACDIRMAAATAQLGLPEVSLGWLPGWGGLRRLVTLIGPACAHDLVLSARRVEADEALRLGLVSRVLPAAALQDAALELAERIASYSPEAVALAKRALRDPELGQAFDAEALVQLRRELRGRQGA